MRIRAAVLEEFGQPLNVQEIELADPNAGEVLVRLMEAQDCIRASSIISPGLRPPAV